MMNSSNSEQIFTKFLDDAAIFPPGLAPLETAVSLHLSRSQNTVTDQFIGPLILSMDKLKEAASLAAGHALDVSVVLPADQITELANLLGGEGEDLSGEELNPLNIVSIELKNADIQTASNLAINNPDMEIYVELPYEEISEESLAALKQGGLKLKFRTGGVTQDLFPTHEQTLDVIEQTVRWGVPFKLTAGLHRAMRYVDANTGFQHFGFANIAAAVADIQSGNSRAEAASTLVSDDQPTIAEKLTTNPSWRDIFTSFGSCSMTEPAETLQEMGLLKPETAAVFEVE